MFIDVFLFILWQHSWSWAYCVCVMAAQNLKKVIKYNYVVVSPLKPHQHIEGESKPGLKFNFFQCFTAHVGFNLCTLRGLVFVFFWLLLFMGLVVHSSCPATPAAHCAAPHIQLEILGRFRGSYLHHWDQWVRHGRGLNIVRSFGHYNSKKT